MNEGIIRFVEDAYFRCLPDGNQWIVGNEYIELTLCFKCNRLYISGIRSKEVGETFQYVRDDSDATLYDMNLPNFEDVIIEGAKADQINAGGRPALQVEIILKSSAFRYYIYVISYPLSSVLRYWVEIENISGQVFKIKQPTVFQISLNTEQGILNDHLWMSGDNNRNDSLTISKSRITQGYNKKISSKKQIEYIPWMSFQYLCEDMHGFCAWLEYLHDWSMEVKQDFEKYILYKVITSIEIALDTGCRLKMPTITLCTYQKDIDNLMEQMYRWQYTYLWDYTNHEYFTRMPWAVAWYYNVCNLQENFAGRLASLDMDFADLIRASGMNMLWDDAGWSENPDIWQPSREGPDFSQTLRYLAKMDIKWILWFCGQPSGNLMDTKVGSWGNFQWRTDGIWDLPYEQEGEFRSKIESFLIKNPRCSFHTCDGGGKYSHTFEIQRFADTNYLSDPGSGDQTNYYTSYFEIPDKWVDVMPAWYNKGVYNPGSGRQTLTMVPSWVMYTTTEGLEQLRKVAEIYKFLLKEGVAGRWSYMYHPRIEGDEEYYYMQRTSYDRTKACIVIKRNTHNLHVSIYPKGLLPEHMYSIDFNSRPSEMIVCNNWGEKLTIPSKRSGSDLMENGIEISAQTLTPDEIIFLGMPNHPGSKRNVGNPEAPSRAFSKRETNLGHNGVGVYWSPGSAKDWVSYYEISRNGEIIGKASTGTYYFDHAPGWASTSAYAVRTVDGDGNVSGWTSAEKLVDDQLRFSSLGGFYPQQGRDGWYAEYSVDGIVFIPMKWIPPVYSPAGDMGGNADQKGGVEGYWEADGYSRVGRGWQTAGIGAWSVRRWKACHTGRIRVTGRVMKEYYRLNKGGILKVCIMLNNKAVWPEDGWAEIKPGDLNGLEHNLILEVSQGDCLRFVLGEGKSPETDIISWMPLISYSAGEQNEAKTEVRILCGSSEDYIDGCGNVWQSDRYYTGGKAINKAEKSVENCLPIRNDYELYRNGREGEDFIYSIPVAPGIYTVRLKFAETQYIWFFERPFNIEVNGQEMVMNFDICQAAKGFCRAYEKVFRYVVADVYDRITLRFNGGFDPLQSTKNAIVQAIEVLPEFRQIIRINCGSTKEHIDWNSDIWSSDMCFLDGEIIKSYNPVKQASPTIYDQALYQTARSGRKITYVISVNPGLYVVHLKFAELWLDEPGQRQMNIVVNGRQVRDFWDPGIAAGHVDTAADIRIEDITPDKDGYIVIQLTATGKSDAIIQGIEVE